MNDFLGAAAPLAGIGGGVWLLRWLVQRAVAQIDASLLRVGDRLDMVERQQQRHGETLAIVAHTLGIRARKGGSDEALDP